MSRAYDKDDPKDRAWRVSIYQAALANIVPILKDLGGAASHNEICSSFALRFPDLCDDDIYQPPSSSHPRVTYPQWKHTIATAEQTLKKQGKIRSANGMWRIDEVPVDRVPRPPNKDLPDRLLERVLELAPQGFERLIGILLAKLGFVNVELTGGPRDGGIDGKFELNLVGLSLAFQAKRYQPGNIIRSNEIRNFRGAMVAKQQSGGLFITTSSFTDEARMESHSPGPTIALVDGKKFVEVLIEYQIGIKEVIVDAEIDVEFFRDL